MAGGDVVYFFDIFIMKKIIPTGIQITPITPKSNINKLDTSFNDSGKPRLGTMKLISEDTMIPPIIRTQGKIKHKNTNFLPGDFFNALLLG